MTGIDKLKNLLETTFDDYPDASLQAHIKEAVAEFDTLAKAVLAMNEAGKINKQKVRECYELANTHKAARTEQSDERVNELESELTALKSQSNFYAVSYMGKLQHVTISEESANQYSDKFGGIYSVDSVDMAIAHNALINNN